MWGVFEHTLSNAQVIYDFINRIISEGVVDTTASVSPTPQAPYMQGDWKMLEESGWHVKEQEDYGSCRY